MTTTRKTPWLLFILFLLCAAAASSAGVYFYLGKQQTDAEPVAKVDGVASKPQLPLLVTIAPMTVNIQNEGNEQSLLYVGFVLEVGNESTQQFIQHYMPQVRSRLLTLLGGQNSSRLANAQGKDALAVDILEALRQPMAKQQPELAVLNVFYTDFIVQ